MISGINMIDVDNQLTKLFRILETSPLCEEVHDVSKRVFCRKHNSSID